ncbi:MAG TPA: ABC transporter permease [Actinomycetes bacterium]
MPRDTTLRQPADPARGAEDTDRLEAGLDALQASYVPEAGGLRGAVRASVPPLIAVGLVLTVWQGLVWAEVKPVYLLPGPLDVWRAFVDAWSRGDAQKAFSTSLERGVLGFVVAVAVGTPLGVVVARVRPVRTAIGPLVTGLQVLPSVAWVPAGIIWFGLSDATVYFVILMGAVPSIVNGLVAGVDQVPPLYRRVGRVLGAGRLAMVRHVILPAALPGYLAGLKQGWAFSWRSLMAAEIIAVGGQIGFGLGALLQQGRELSDMSVVVLAILLILVVGIAVELLVFAPVERRVLRGRGLHAETA